MNEYNEFAELVDIQTELHSMIPSVGYQERIKINKIIKKIDELKVYLIFR